MILGASILQLPAIKKAKEMGLEVVGEAASGIEAINIIDKLRPDIIFVDIRMPFMDGIEFSKIALKRYRQMKIIILTAFDEFEYAKEAVHLEIEEYWTWDHGLSSKTDRSHRHPGSLPKSDS